MRKTQNVKRKKKKKGFSLIESLLCMSLFLFITIASLEFFSSTRTHFFKLKTAEETNAAAFSALDKMRIDCLDGGLGLIIPIEQGILEGISEKNSDLIILSREMEIPPLNDLFAGQTRIQLESTKNMKRGKQLVFFDSNKGEIHSISSVDQHSIVLSSPLNSPFLKEKTSMLLLRKITLFFDNENQIIRRKVNASPAQPLLEEVASFNFEYDKNSNLVTLRLSLETKKEKEYEITVFPKNTAMAALH